MYTDYGVMEILGRPRRFKYNCWSDNHGTDDLPENRMTIEYVLQLQGGKTLLSLTHANLLTPDREAVMLQVWNFLLSRPQGYVEGV